MLTSSSSFPLSSSSSSTVCSREQTAKQLDSETKQTLTHLEAAQHRMWTLWLVKITFKRRCSKMGADAVPGSGAVVWPTEEKERREDADHALPNRTSAQCHSLFPMRLYVSFHVFSLYFLPSILLFDVTVTPSLPYKSLGSSAAAAAEDE